MRRTRPCCGPAAPMHPRAVVRSTSYGVSTSPGTFPAIQLGAKDSDADGAVLWVARALLGSSIDSYPTFDSRLDTAVKNFQRQKGLTADGIVGPNTYRALGYEGRVETGSGAPPKPDSALTQRAWFWPAVILTSALGIAAGIVFWPRRDEYVARAKAWRK